MREKSFYRVSPYENSASRGRKKTHTPTTGLTQVSTMSEGKFENLIYGEELKNPLKNRFSIGDHGGESEARALIAKALRDFEKTNQPKIEGKKMTVSLYASTASGSQEIVVQTNAQSLDLYIAGLADALDGAIEQMDTDKRAELLASLLRNAFPVAFAIAGYKADRVTESRMLVCGAAAPGEANLLAHSKT